MAEENILKVLKDLHISYEIQEHIPLFSEKDAQNVEITLQGIDVKNLFVKDKKGHYSLVSMDLHKRADLTKIAEALGFGRLSFCTPEELMTYLHITPGSVTPLALMFDKNCRVQVLFDKNFAGNHVIIHPLRNTASVSIAFDDLVRFLEHYNHGYSLADVYKDEGVC